MLKFKTSPTTAANSGERAFALKPGPGFIPRLAAVLRGVFPNEALSDMRRKPRAVGG